MDQAINVFTGFPELPQELPQPAAPAKSRGTRVIGAPAFTGMTAVNNEEADDDNNDRYTVCILSNFAPNKVHRLSHILEEGEIVGAVNT